MIVSFKRKTVSPPNSNNYSFSFKSNWNNKVTQRISYWSSETEASLAQKQSIALSQQCQSLQDQYQDYLKQQEGLIALEKWPSLQTDLTQTLHKSVEQEKIELDDIMKKIALLKNLEDQQADQESYTQNFQNQLLMQKESFTLSSQLGSLLQSLFAHDDCDSSFSDLKLMIDLSKLLTSDIDLNKLFLKYEQQKRLLIEQIERQEQGQQNLMKDIERLRDECQKNDKLTQKQLDQRRNQVQQISSQTQNMIKQIKEEGKSEDKVNHVMMSFKKDVDKIHQARLKEIKLQNKFEQTEDVIQMIKESRVRDELQAQVTLDAKKQERIRIVAITCVLIEQIVSAEEEYKGKIVLNKELQQVDNACSQKIEKLNIMLQQAQSTLDDIHSQNNILNKIYGISKYDQMILGTQQKFTAINQRVQYNSSLLRTYQKQQKACQQQIQQFGPALLQLYNQLSAQIDELMQNQLNAQFQEMTQFLQELISANQQSLESQLKRKQLEQLTQQIDQQIERCEKKIEEIKGLSIEDPQINELDQQIKEEQKVNQNAKQLLKQNTLINNSSQNENCLSRISHIYDQLIKLEDKLEKKKYNDEKEDKSAKFKNLLSFQRLKKQADKVQLSVDIKLLQIQNHFKQSTEQLDQKTSYSEITHRLNKSIKKVQNLKSKINEAKDPYIQSDHILLQDCISALNNQLEALNSIEEDMNRLKKAQDEELSKQAERHSKIALIRSQLKSIQPLIRGDLRDTFNQIDKLSDNIDKLAKFMNQSVDYESKKAQIEKIIENLSEISNQNGEVQFEYEELQAYIPQVPKELGSLTLEQMSLLESEIEQSANQMNQLTQKADQILKNLQKLRNKIGDLELPDLIAKKQQQYLQQQQKQAKCENDLQQVLQYIDNSVSSITQPQDALTKINGLQKFLKRTMNGQNQIQQRLQNLKASILNVQLSQESAQFLLPLLFELKDINILLTQKETDLENIISQVTFLKKKFEGQDLSKRLSSLQEASDQVQQRLSTLSKYLLELQDLCDDFSGYCSDELEDSLVNKLTTSDLRDLQSKLRALQEANQGVIDRLHLLEARQQPNNQAMQELDDILAGLSVAVAELEKVVMRHQQGFERIKGIEKLEIREREIDELERRISQMGILLERIQEESQSEVDRARADSSKQMILNELNEIRREIEEIKNECSNRMTKSLIEQRLQIGQIRAQISTFTQFELLRKNKRIKRQLLGVLKQAKAQRTQITTLRTRFEGCKLRLRTMPKYNALIGDDVDRMLADWIYATCCPIPISRLGDGYYQFGQKKIYAKITNGKLVIRVGGGYMGIDEFMYYYGAQELNKLLAYEGIKIEEDLDLDQIMHEEEGKKGIINQFDDGTTVVGNQNIKKRLSPGRNSIRQNEGSRSPRLIQKVSPERAFTPSVQNMMKSGLRKSAQATNSPRSQLSNRLKSTTNTDTISVSAKSQLQQFIQMTAPQVANKKSPRQNYATSQSSRAANNVSQQSYQGQNCENDDYNLQLKHGKIMSQLAGTPGQTAQLKLKGKLSPRSTTTQK